MQRKTTEQFISEAKKIHGNKFDYTLTNYINNRTAIKIICPIHGLFEQMPNVHIKAKSGCPKCRYDYSSKSLRKTTKSFIEKAMKIHPEYDYSQVEYITAKTKVKIICHKHGIFLMKPNHLLGGQGCPKCGTERMANNQRISHEEFINQVKKIYPQYDYSKSKYIDSKTKVSVICPEHGEFKISPGDIFHGNCGCPKCGILRRVKAQTKTTEQFIKEARKIHGDRYDYSLVEYTNNKTKVKIICPIHGLFEQSPQSHLKDGQNCPRCSISQGEEKIMIWLNNHKYSINQDYITQKRFKELGGLSYDFYIPSKNLLIEFNGIQHYKICKYSDSLKKLKEQRHRDWIKRKFAKDKGIRLLTIKYTDFDKIPEILSKELQHQH